MNPTTIDILDARNGRQELNNITAYNQLKENVLTKINFKKLERYLKAIGLTKDQLFKKCKDDDIFARASAFAVAIDASRQGANDESTQIATCNLTMNQLNFNMKKINNNSARPNKNGNIDINQKKSENSLKSFDAIILKNKKKIGYAFIKVVKGKGGHQDNVFEEAHTLCDWISRYNKTELFIILIDTDLLDELDQLKKKKGSNIIIGSHTEIQQYFIDAK